MASGTNPAKIKNINKKHSRKDARYSSAGQQELNTIAVQKSEKQKTKG